MVLTVCVFPCWLSLLIGESSIRKGVKKEKQNKQKKVPLKQKEIKEKAWTEREKKENTLGEKKKKRQGCNFNVMMIHDRCERISFHSGPPSMA